jgi:hypothetical protein
MNSSAGVLTKPAGDEGGSADIMLEAVSLFKSGKYREARKRICENTRADEIDGMYRWMYDNLDLWGKTDEQQDQAILIIKQGLVNHTLCADPEINLAATLIELTSAA